ncbi:MAG: aconitase/3-isopropylmalate dehydratase large subunit family protein [Candidatus Binataceae bacterium]
MGMTMAEKILARHSGQAAVRPGDIVVCEVDKIVQIDLVFAASAELPKRIADANKIAIVLDHAIPAPTIGDAEGQSIARQFARRFGIEKFYDVGRHGICHQVILENGLALPGQILTCADSHTCASGAFNCVARGMGPLEMLQIMCTGKTWYQVAPTVKFDLHGRKPDNVFGKDIFLHLAGIAGSVEGHNIEFAGSGIADLPLDDRATLATMGAELSAEFVTFPADAKAIEHLRTVTDEPFEPVRSDSDAHYAATYEVDLSGLRPYIAKPDFIPHNTMPVGDLDRKIAIDQAFLGSCANGKLEDFRVAAQIVRGRKVAPGVRFIVTPASQKVLLEAVRRGYVETLLEAGAVVTNSTCGACYGGHMGVLGAGEVCITSSTRNFKGRMGSPSARIYMASSATVAASAIAGHICDPTPLLGDNR